MQATDYIKPLLKRKELPDIRPGDTIRVFERVQEGGKTRTAAFEGMVIGRRHGNEPGATVTVRKISYGIGVERIFPLYAPTIEKFVIVRRAKVRRAKLTYLRKRIGKRAVLRGELMPPETGQPEEPEAVAEESAEDTDAIPADVAIADAKGPEEENTSSSESPAPAKASEDKQENPEGDKGA